MFDIINCITWHLHDFWKVECSSKENLNDLWSYWNKTCTRLHSCALEFRKPKWARNWELIFLEYCSYNCILEFLKKPKWSRNWEFILQKHFVSSMLLKGKCQHVAQYYDRQLLLLSLTELQTLLLATTHGKYMCCLSHVIVQPTII